VRWHGSYRLIIDSGAFTAWNTDKKIEINEYCDFLKKVQLIAPFKAIQLDVFGDPKRTAENYKIMKDHGLDVMPVFTRGDSLDKLESMYQDTDYVMLGGVAFGAGNANYVKWFSNNNKKRKCHWLGFVDMNFIKEYRPESVDSSSWKSGAMFGNVSVYAGNGLIKTYGRSDLTSGKCDINEFKRYLAALQLGPNAFSNLLVKESWSSWGTGIENRVDVPVKGLSQRISTISHLLRSFEVEKKLGTKIYLRMKSKSKASQWSGSLQKKATCLSGIQI